MSEDSLLSMLTTLSRVRDEETGCFIERTSAFVRILAQNLKDRGLEENDRYHTVERVRRVEPLQNIGKIGIPDRVLQKSARLNKEE